MKEKIMNHQIENVEEKGRLCLKSELFFFSG